MPLRDGVHAKDYVRMAMDDACQQESTDDFVVPTGIQYSVPEILSNKTCEFLDIEVESERRG